MKMEKEVLARIWRMDRQEVLGRPV